MGRNYTLIRTDTIHGRYAYPNSYQLSKKKEMLPFTLSGTLCLLAGKKALTVHRETLCMTTNYPSVAENRVKESNRSMAKTSTQCQWIKGKNSNTFWLQANQKILVGREKGIR